MAISKYQNTWPTLSQYLSFEILRTTFLNYRNYKISNNFSVPHFSVEPYHKFGALKSFTGCSWNTQIVLISRSRGSRIVKGPVRYVEQYLCTSQNMSISRPENCEILIRMLKIKVKWLRHHNHDRKQINLEFMPLESCIIDSICKMWSCLLNQHR